MNATSKERVVNTDMYILIESMSIKPLLRLRIIFVLASILLCFSSISADSYGYNLTEFDAGNTLTSKSCFDNLYLSNKNAETFYPGFFTVPLGVNICFGMDSYKNLDTYISSTFKNDDTVTGKRGSIYLASGETFSSGDFTITKYTISGNGNKVFKRVLADCSLIKLKSNRTDLGKLHGFNRIEYIANAFAQNSIIGIEIDGLSMATYSADFHDTFCDMFKRAIELGFHGQIKNVKWPKIKTSTKSSSNTSTSKIKATASIQTISTTHHVSRNGTSGMLLKTNFTVSGMKGKKGIVSHTFYINGNQRLYDSNFHFRGPTGEVAAWQTYTPIYDNAKFTDFEVFIPYSELHLKTTPMQNIPVKVRTEILDENGKIIASDSGNCSFEFGFFKKRALTNKK